MDIYYGENMIMKIKWYWKWWKNGNGNNNKYNAEKSTDHSEEINDENANCKSTLRNVGKQLPEQSVQMAGKHGQEIMQSQWSVIVSNKCNHS